MTRLIDLYSRRITAIENSLSSNDIEVGDQKLAEVRQQLHNKLIDLKKEKVSVELKRTKHLRALNKYEEGILYGDSGKKHDGALFCHRK